MTSAPRSARCTEPNGPAPYCSTATMRTSANGRGTAGDGSGTCPLRSGSSAGATRTGPSHGRRQRRQVVDVHLRELVVGELLEVVGHDHRVGVLAVREAGVVEAPQDHRAHVHEVVAAVLGDRV